MECGELKASEGECVPLLLRIRATLGLMNAEHRRIQASAWTCTPHSSVHVLRIPFGPGLARMRRTEGLDAEEEYEVHEPKTQLNAR